MNTLTQVKIGHVADTNKLLTSLIQAEAALARAAFELSDQRRHNLLIHASDLLEHLDELHQLVEAMRQVADPGSGHFIRSVESDKP